MVSYIKLSSKRSAKESTLVLLIDDDILGLRLQSVKISSQTTGVTFCHTH